MKKIAVLGVGKSGFEAIKFLNKRGYDLFVSDANSSVSNEVVDYLKENNVGYEFGKNSEKILDCDTIILSPGIPRKIDIIKSAMDNGIEVINDVELLYRFGKYNKLVAITGSNGKTTVTTLLGYVLNKFTKTFVGGNIGVAALEFFNGDYDNIVLELSSFQLESIKDFRADVSVITNITPDHMNRYDTLGDYADAKFNIIKNSNIDDFLVFNANDKLSIERESEFDLQKICFSSTKDGDITLKDNIILFDKYEFNINELKLKGKHNIENVMAVLGVLKALDLDLNLGFEYIKEFPGVEHRMEYVDTIDGVSYYNDSKATNVESAVAALDSFDNSVIWLAGGIDKNLPIEDMKNIVKLRVKKAIFFGQDRKKFENIFSGVVDFSSVPTLRDGVNLAKKIAQNGDVVLLSPVCTSFDEFDNYEHRGKSFKKWIYG